MISIQQNWYLSRQWLMRPNERLHLKMLSFSTLRTTQILYIYIYTYIHLFIYIQDIFGAGWWWPLSINDNSDRAIVQMVGADEHNKFLLPNLLLKKDFVKTYPNALPRGVEGTLRSRGLRLPGLGGTTVFTVVFVVEEFDICSSSSITFVALSWWFCETLSVATFKSKVNTESIIFRVIFFMLPWNTISGYILNSLKVHWEWDGF